MQTLLSRFCEEFVRILQPMVPPLGRCAEVISKGGDTGDAPGKATQAALLDLRHQMELLCNKVADQQAYVLIFGPLKSGKSTLMNAIAASYVSEVSSLPAYPCMVFVSHAPKREFVLTRYSGVSTSFARPEELKVSVDLAHSDLAKRIRDAEVEGKPFDPSTQFDQAISRIDVRVPAVELEQSRAVLVDTPGLYSRMKFGYDRMTRDFRNAAACAVFVVRSDNLFLEQVFAEFNDLLELFSRIFLVVNIDSSKQDLGPDGKLMPSLEQQDPHRIIEAFEDLAMSAPLKKAASEGRLRIYPADLLRAARKRLEPAKDAGATKSGGADFDAFHDDLTEYLNSTDYLVSFLGDSLRRATTLAGEVAQLCNHADFEKQQDRFAKLEDERSRHGRRLEAIRKLAGFDWAGALQQLAGDLTNSCRELAAGVEKKTSTAVSDAVRRWFKNNQSLQDLNKKELAALFIRHQEELTAAASRELSERLLQKDLGIELTAEIRDALDAAQIDLAAISRDAHGKTDRKALIAVPPTPLRSDMFTVRKTFWDVVLFRSQTALRRRLFGQPDGPKLAIAREQKTSRLGDGAKSEIRRRLDAYERSFFDETVDRVLAGFARGYCNAVLEDLTRALRESTATIETQLDRVKSEQQSLKQLLEPLDDLRKQSRDAADALEKLGKHYGQVDLFLLTQPVEAPFTMPAQPPAQPSAKSTAKRRELS